MNVRHPRGAPTELVLSVYDTTMWHLENPDGQLHLFVRDKALHELRKRPYDAVLVYGRRPGGTEYHLTTYHLRRGKA